MLLTTLAFAFAQGIANVMDNLNYQVVGIMVVMLCLGGMAVILPPLPLRRANRA